MSFLKELGSFVGQVAGDVVGGTVKVVGEVTGSKLIEEIGDGVKQASYFAGDKLGEAASGTWDIASGIITQDEAKLDEGLGDIGKAVGDTAKAAGHAVCNVVDNGSNVLGGLLDGDSDRIVEGTKGLVKVGAVGALSFGVIDLIDGVDHSVLENGDSGMAAVDHSLPTSSDTSLVASESDVTLVENPNTHHVEPHWRTLSDGTKIWVDGDGDTSINTYEGWEQSNPDYRIKG
ncbi:hypothetical protein BGM26_19950 [Bacillus sp. FJAT-29790]|uniref:hypothetical protein n=1 Tax=Bacillus sp. FJAT-29790 TaxID=1895002 RepID=UPI001C22AFEB|nr:hypothetical protein [Bacillus sp. FJAT-29790]MBU8881201.1 hypothetical protein [Bacillus sp. FJAT-29790]